MERLLPVLARLAYLRWSILVLILGLFLGSASAQEGKTKVLLIGTQDFVSPTFPPLAGISSDLDLMKATMVDSCGVAPENIKTILSTRSNAISKASVVATLESFFGSAGPNDALLVYLTSHGVVYEGEYQIAMSETRVSPEALTRTSLSAGQLRKWSEKSRAKTVLVVLDTCQFPLSQQVAAEIAASGKAMSNRTAAGMTSQVAAKFLGNPQSGAGIRAILYSCRPSEESYMDTNYLTGTNNSYFTLALCEGLQGKAAGSQGEVSLKSLNDYTTRRLAELIETDRQYRIAKGETALPGPQTSNMEVLGGQPSAFILSTVSQQPPTVASVQSPPGPPRYPLPPTYPSANYPSQNQVYQTLPPAHPVPPATAAVLPTYPAPTVHSPQTSTTGATIAPAAYPATMVYPTATAYPAISSYPSPTAYHPPMAQPYPVQAAAYPTTAPPPMTSMPTSPPYSPPVQSQPPVHHPAAISGAPPALAGQSTVQPAGLTTAPPMPATTESAQVESTRVTGGILELFPSTEFRVASADLPSGAKGLGRDVKAAAKIASEDFGLQLRYDRGESDANIRVTVNSKPSAPSTDVFVRVMASADRQTWTPIREWSFRLPTGYRVSRDYVGADPQLFAHSVFFLRVELVLPNDTIVVKEGRFTAQLIR